MHSRIYSWGSVETFTGQVPQLPDQKPAEVVHFQPSNYKEQVWYAILGFSCCCLFPVACAIAHITCVLNSKYHANSPEIKVECYNSIQWHQSIFFPVCLWSCRSGLSLGSGLFPICQRGAKELFGVGFGLIHSVLETPKAPTHPHAFRVGVPGISTAKNQNPQTSPLICKGEIVQRYKVLTSQKRTWNMCITPLPPPFLFFSGTDGCTAWLRHMGECSQTLMKCTCQQGKSQMWRAGMMKNCTVGMMNSSKCLTSISTKCGQTVSLISNVVHF